MPQPWARRKSRRQYHVLLGAGAAFLTQQFLDCGRCLSNSASAFAAAKLSRSGKELQVARGLPGARPDLVTATSLAATSNLGAADASSAENDALGEWCLLVINLERRPDRLANLQKLLGATNPGLLHRLERIDAVDGRNIELNSTATASILEPETLARAKRAKQLGLYTVVHDDENNLVSFDDHLTEGAVACAMSHYKALERVATHPTAEWGLILEDDVSMVVPDIEKAIAGILRRLPADWNAVFLGYHHEDAKPHPLVRNVTAKAGLRMPAKGEDILDERVFEIHDHSWGLYAWMVSKAAARSLVAGLFPISSQVDFAISSFLVRRHRQVYCVFPDRLLFYSPTSEEGQDSDIQTMRSEHAVVEEHGSWQEYCTLQRPSYYDLEAEDFYDFLDGAPDYLDDASDWEEAAAAEEDPEALTV